MTVRHGNPARLPATVQNQKSGQEVAKSVKSKSEAKIERKLPKTHVDYWKARLERHRYTYNGKPAEVNEWSARIKFQGLRKSFALHSPNKDAAAAKARNIYLSLVAKGWDETLREYASPKLATLPVAVKGEPTVGDFLAEVERTSQIRPRTFHRYAQYFRMLAAFVKGIKDHGEKFNYRTGGRQAWLQKVNSVPLRAITPEAAANWKLWYLARGQEDPQKQVRVRRSFNAALRHCKSLFSKNVVYQPNFRVVIPRFLIKDGQGTDRKGFWFEGLKFEKAGSMKFHAPVGISYESLLRDGYNELRGPNPEAYKLLLLCLCAGLRRAEADTLLRSQLDKKESCIRIHRTQYMEPKHDSGGEVYVDPAVITELLSTRGEEQGDFLVNSPVEWKRTIHFRYRCAPHWETLNDWLGGKGITAIKRVHELRKLFGDAIVKQQGIFAGAAQLRHSSIQMTVSHYTDPRQRAALPVGRLLTDQQPKASPDEKTRRKRKKTS